MNNRKKLKNTQISASRTLLEIKALIAAVIETEQCEYPANYLIDMAYSKIKNLFIKSKNAGSY